jgi:hypothetical protein
MMGCPRSDDAASLVDVNEVSDTSPPTFCSSGYVAGIHVKDRLPPTPNDFLRDHLQLFLNLRY